MRGDGVTQLSFVIMYTRDVASKMAFYERAFGMQQGRLADTGVYGEMLGGDVKVQFVQEDFARQYVPNFLPNRLERPAPGIEIGFIFNDVATAFQRAIDAGCTSVAAPAKRPWGPTIGFVRDDEGVLVEMMQIEH